MKLDVLPTSEPWYADGLTFTCTQCGNCCTGGPGYVWVSEQEIQRLAAFLELTPEQVLSRYCRKFGDRWSFKERRTPAGNYDCVFLKEIDAPARPVGRELPQGAPVPQKRRICSIYSMRPLQCRTWPFWGSLLSGKQAWDNAGRKCPGINRGSRKFTVRQIEALRDAEDWPQNPPTSRKPGSA
jgi:uncharacterized protein